MTGGTRAAPRREKDKLQACTSRSSMDIVIDLAQEPPQSELEGVVRKGSLRSAKAKTGPANVFAVLSHIFATKHSR